ncbi:CASP-like protein 4U1 [Phragmites australis]|uniref:CASP-like protein 4U1 n=1 Tax=Phragmites australis TaxID=29695 RepID=UPI002D76CFDA|nr:CASP-like protein 4U1 [Phragmites australis]
MASTPRTPAPVRPPPPPPLEPPPSPPGDEYHTPPPSLGEASPREETNSTNYGSEPANSPPLSPVRLPLQHRLPPPNSPTGQNGQESVTAAGPAAARPQLRLATGLVRTPSHGSLARSPSPSPTPLSPLTPAPAVARSPSPSPTPPSSLTPAPVPAINSRSGQSTPKRAEAWKPPASPVAAAIAVQFDPVEEAVTSPLRVGKARLDQQQRATVTSSLRIGKARIDQQQRTAMAAAENGNAATTAVPPDVAAVAAVGERRELSVALRLATALLSLAAFSVMASARTSGWAGDDYARHEQYRYAVAVNVIVCVYSIAQSFGEIRRLISPRFIFRSMSSYYVSLFLDQVLAYLLMSASSAAASRNDLWVSRFGTDPFNKKISSAVWLSFIGFLTLAANSLVSTANLFSMV